MIGARQHPCRVQVGELLLDEACLARDVESGEHEGHLVTETAEGVQPDLERRWRRLAAHPGDADAVDTVRRELDGVEASGDIGPGVARPADLVQQLCGHRADGDRAAGLVVLGDDRRTVLVQFGDRESGVARIGDLFEERIVTAAGLRTALDDVARDDRAGQRVVVGRTPAEVCDRRPDDERGIGHPSGDDDLSAAAQALGDAEGAQIGVGGERVAERELAAAGTQVVALDVSDCDVEPERLGQSAHCRGEPGRVQAAGVRDDRDAVLERRAEGVLELAQEGLGVAQRLVAGAIARQDEHRELGEVVAGQHIERAAGEHLVHGRGTIAVEAGAVADPQHVPTLAWPSEQIKPA